MANPTSPIFKQTDVALAQYYQHLNVANYSDSNNVGLFINYIKTEELDDPQLPIEEELGDNCDPFDCTYTHIWMNSSINFPIPSYAQIPHDAIEAFIFYILQYCYKYTQPPSKNYIQTVLVPQCNGRIITSLPQNLNKALCLFEDNLPTPHIYHITIWVKFYARICDDCIIYDDILNCIKLYIFGKEGAICDDSVIDADSIANIDNGERLTTRSDHAITYYTTVSKNRRDFCMEMKQYYKASYGKIVKIFEELKNICN